MKKVFVDTAYFVAISNPKNQWYRSAQQAKIKLDYVEFVTTDEVLTEYLTAYSKFGPYWREKAVNFVELVLSDPQYKVVPQSRSSFVRGLGRYRNRTDKNYSLQDCISMCVMEYQSITEVLTSDHDFEQEGFVILMK